jgi:hypothetical protein
VSGQTISSTAFNTLVTDIYTEITNSLDRQGRSAMLAALPMGGNIITGHGTPLVSTDVPNKAYVDAIVASFFSTGDTKTTFKTVADTGWIMLNDGTFGSATSGSSTRANADTLALFTLFFNNIADADAPLLTSGGGATTRAAQVNAASAWAANCRMTLPKALGSTLGIAGAGSGLTARPLGAYRGGETSTLLTANLPPYTPAGSLSVTSAASVSQGGGSSQNDDVTGNVVWVNPSGHGPLTSTGTLSGTAQGGTSTPVSIMQPTTYQNCMVKL